LASPEREPVPARKKSRLRSSQASGRALRRRPTINDVARLANVSKKTVSRVINNSPLVRSATRERVGAVISDLSFFPDPQARGLAFRRSCLVGLICDDPLPQGTVEIQQGILDALAGTGFELVVRSASRTDAKFLPDVRAFVEGQRLFGVLLTSPLSDDAALSGLLREIGCPVRRILSADGKANIDVAFAAATALVAAKS
jgi:LacI family transcriptional regulator